MLKPLRRFKVPGNLTIIDLMRQGRDHGMEIQRGTVERKLAQAGVSGEQVPADVAKQLVREAWWRRRLPQMLNKGYLIPLRDFEAQLGMPVGGLSHRKDIGKFMVGQRKYITKWEAKRFSTTYKKEVAEKKHLEMEAVKQRIDRKKEEAKAEKQKRREKARKKEAARKEQEKAKREQQRKEKVERERRNAEKIAERYKQAQERRDQRKRGLFEKRRRAQEARKATREKAGAAQAVQPRQGAVKPAAKKPGSGLAQRQARVTAEEKADRAAVRKETGAAKRPKKPAAAKPKVNPKLAKMLIKYKRYAVFMEGEKRSTMNTLISQAEKATPAEFIKNFKPRLDRVLKSPPGKKG